MSETAVLKIKRETRLGYVYDFYDHSYNLYFSHLQPFSLFRQPTFFGERDRMCLANGNVFRVQTHARCFIQCPCCVLIIRRDKKKHVPLQDYECSSSFRVLRMTFCCCLSLCIENWIDYLLSKQIKTRNEQQPRQQHLFSCFILFLLGFDLCVIFSFLFCSFALLLS